MKIALAIFAISSAALFAADFWQQKPAGEWSEKDCSRLVAKSPWAKDTPVNMLGAATGRGSGMGEGRGGRGSRGQGTMGEVSADDRMIGAGSGRGGQNGNNDIQAQQQSTEPPHVVVRWDSSSAVRAAMKKVSISKSVEDADAQAFYIIAVDGIHLPQRNGAAAPSVNTGPAGPRQLPVEQQDRLKASTTLTPKGKDAIQPGKVDVIPDDGGKMTFRFYFPKSTELSLDDKEVSFQSRIGPAEVKQKFVLKDMTFDGKLAL